MMSYIKEIYSRHNFKTACVFGHLGENVITLTRRNEIHGEDDFAFYLSGCEDTPNSEPKKMAHNGKKFAFGDKHILILDQKGKAYSWGSNDFGALGHYEKDNSSVPSVLQEQEVKDIACGAYHNVALGRDETIYFWGKGSYTDYYGEGVDDLEIVTVAEAKGKPTGVFCTSYSSLVLYSNGEVFGWGDRSNNDIGLGDSPSKNRNEPKKINFRSKRSSGDVKIKNIACGANHSLALSSDGELFVTGSNKSGQLGLKERSIFRNFKSHQFFKEKIIDIATSRFVNLSAAVTESSKIYVWGLCAGVIISHPILTPFKSLHEVFLHLANYSITYQAITKNDLLEIDWTSVANDLVEIFRMAYQEETKCSFGKFIFFERNDKIPLHKSILRLRCRDYSKTYENQLKISSQNVVEIDGISRISSKVNRVFHQYMYTNDVIVNELSWDEVIELIELAMRNSQKLLALNCKHYIGKNITANCWKPVWKYADQMQKLGIMADVARNLKKLCVPFTKDDPMKIINLDSDSWCALDINNLMTDSVMNSQSQSQ